jgi:glycosyltransferase involved in cell wall biosynthesis
MTNKEKTLRVAIIAPPWLALPVKGYGGIELVIQGIVEQLCKQNVEVVVYANGARKMKGVITRSLYKKEALDVIDLPYYDAPLQIMQAHLHFALNDIEKDGKFDIIHDHNPYIGPSFFSLASQQKTIPPVLHTFHGPPFSTDTTADDIRADNRLQLEYMNLGRLYMVCISEAMSKQAPKHIQSHLLPAVHNAIDVEAFPFVEQKKNYYVTLARFTKDKGQHVAIKFAIKNKKRLRMAGTVAGMGSNRRVLLELSNPLSTYRKNAEFRYFSDYILRDLLQYPRITFTGNLSGRKKARFLSDAKALLFPIDWEEPFGMAVIEALACGTPVVAMNRGAMPEIIEHGVNGFLANNEKEFEEYALRVDEISPEACRQSVIDKFSSSAMAAQYIDRYKEVIARAG